jgi:hypothetical protein
MTSSHTMENLFFGPRWRFFQQRFRAVKPQPRILNPVQVERRIKSSNSTAHGASKKWGTPAPSGNSVPLWVKNYRLKARQNQKSRSNADMTSSMENGTVAFSSSLVVTRIRSDDFFRNCSRKAGSTSGCKAINAAL